MNTPDSDEPFEIHVTDVEEMSLPHRAPAWRGQGHHSVGTTNLGDIVIAVQEDVLQQVHAHAASKLQEIGGILIGQAYEWEGQTYVEITAALPASMTDASGTHVTFTPETWADLLARQKQRFPNDMMLGWYHSHPRMGIFLSGLDLDLHRNFFQSAWHVALVFNGQDRKLGFFAWQGDDIRPCRGFYLLNPVNSPRRAAHFQVFEGGTNVFTYDEASPVAPEPEPAFTPPQAEQSNPPRFPVGLLSWAIALGIAWFVWQILKRRR